MRHFVGALRSAVLAFLAVAVTAPAAPGQNSSPPNWKGGGAGNTRPAGDVDADVFRGRSSLVGRFTGMGSHALNPLDFTFAGSETWTAEDGDELDVTVEGQVFPSGDPDFPYAFEAVLVADGGTGRFAGARGRATMAGAFTGIPGEFYFHFKGTLTLDGE